MIYNLSTILRETMKQTNKNEKEKEKEKEKVICLDMIKQRPKTPYNLKIDIELANRKSIELYKKYNTNIVHIPKFSILDLNKDLNKDFIEKKSNKTGFTICGICVFAFLAYSYFKK
jgi:hypothetical protein